VRVLIVEDSEARAGLMVQSLLQHGLEVSHRCVQDAEELERALDEGGWDVALIDYDLPGLDGLAAIAQVRDHRFEGPIITVSGTSGERTAVECMRAGAHDYVMKDDLTRLGAVVERSLADAEARRERRRALEALRASEERYRRLIETMGDGIVMIDTDRVITFANEAFAEMVEQKAEALIGMPVSRLCDPDDAAVLEEQLTRPCGEGGGDCEMTLRSRSGRRVPVLTHATALHDDDGHLVGSLGVVTDITARKRAEEERERAYAERELVLNSMSEVLALHDPDRRVLLANRAAAELMGRDPQELIGLKCYEAWHGRDEPCEDCPMDETVRTGRPATAEKSGRDGRVIGVSTYPVFDEAGELVGVVALGRDITERRRVEQALRESEGRYRQLVENVSDIIYTLSPDGIITSVSGAVERISGYRREEVIGRSVGRLFGPEAEEYARGLFREAVRTEADVFQTELEFTARDGTEVVLDVTSRVRVEDGEPVEVVGIARDVTEQKRLEEQLREAVKMEAVGSLAGGVAHDFNNMLTVILGNAQLLTMRVGDDPRLLGPIEEIQVAARRSADLTKQLLAFSRKQVMAPETVDLNDIVEGIEPMLERMIGEHIAIITNLDPELGHVRVDPSQIEQVLMNLAVNARDAMRDGGRLTIETSNVNLDESHPAARPDGLAGPHVMLAVSDTGVGMDPETQSRVFEPFFTSKGEEGTGLGLSTAYGIVAQSGGHITVHSEPGEGSTFRVYLPLLEDEVTHAVEEAEEPGMPGGHETTLVVEDEDILRGLMVDVLRMHGYTVIAAGSGEEAVQLAREHEGEIHLMVTDVVMPGMNGAQLAALMAQERPGMPVLYLSGYASDVIAHYPALDERTDYVQKPLTPQKLLRTIRAILDRED